MKNSFTIKEASDIEEEEPVAILIMEKSGLTLFSCKFLAFDQINDQLIGGLLTAINAFGNEIFKGSGVIDHIVYQDYTLMMKLVDSFTFCYVFKGKSHVTALSKLENFIFQVRNTLSIWKYLIECTESKQKFKVSRSTIMTNILSEVFHH
ncbi:MAG: hypothetical protein ACFE9L_10730 [Candidatus Hodarchaeota archaeon]